MIRSAVHTVTGSTIYLDGIAALLVVALVFTTGCGTNPKRLEANTSSSELQQSWCAGIADVFAAVGIDGARPLVGVESTTKENVCYWSAGNPDRAALSIVRVDASAHPSWRDNIGYPGGEGRTVPSLGDTGGVAAQGEYGWTWDGQLYLWSQTCTGCEENDAIAQAVDRYIRDHPAPSIATSSSTAAPVRSVTDAATGQPSWCTGVADVFRGVGLFGAAPVINATSAPDPDGCYWSLTGSGETALSLWRVAAEDYPVWRYSGSFAAASGGRHVPALGDSGGEQGAHLYAWTWHGQLYYWAQDCSACTDNDSIAFAVDSYLKQHD